MMPTLLSSSWSSNCRKCGKVCDKLPAAGVPWGDEALEKVSDFTFDTGTKSHRIDRPGLVSSPSHTSPRGDV